MSNTNKGPMPKLPSVMRYTVRVFCDKGTPQPVDPDNNYPDMDFVALILGREYNRVVTRKYETAIPEKYDERVLFWFWEYADRMEALAAVEELVRNGFGARCSLVPVMMVPVVKKEQSE